MRIVMPSEVVQTIDELFPQAKTGVAGFFTSGHSSQLRGIISLVKDVPSELINLPPKEAWGLPRLKGQVL
jgi:hypothetical protein